MQTILALFVGIGLAATCGFRVFVPLLGLSIAHHLGHVPLAQGFEWIGSWPAMISFGIATILEVGAYYLPLVDNVLDMIATPAAVVAGTIVTASLLIELSPHLRWPLAVIAGGGVAGVVQGLSVFLRGSSTAATGGFGNPLVSTGELAAAVAGTLVALLLPLVAIVLVGLLLLHIFLRLIRRRRQAV